MNLPRINSRIVLICFLFIVDICPQLIYADETYEGEDLLELAYVIVQAHEAKDFNTVIGYAAPAMNAIDNAIDWENDETGMSGLAITGLIGSSYAMLNNYEKAIESLEMCLNLWNNKVSTNMHVLYGQSMLLGTILTLDGCYQMTNNNHKRTELIDSYEEALEFAKKSLPENHQQITIILSHLVDCYDESGNFQKAIEFETQLLEIKKSELGEQHPDYANSLHALAHEFGNIGNYNEAIRLETEALGIYKNNGNAYLHNKALSLDNLTCFYNDIGDYNNAIQSGTEAVSILQTIVGQEHQDYLRALSNLANNYCCLGNYNKAKDLWNEAAQIGEKVLGTNHPDYAMCLLNLATVYNFLGVYHESIRLGTEAAEIFKRTLGEEDLRYAFSISNLAGHYSSLGDYNEAIRLGTEALEIRKRGLGSMHPDYANSLRSLAYNHALIGDYKTAITLESQALDIIKQSLGTIHPDYAGCLNNLAKFNSLSGNYNKAIELENKVIDITKIALGTDHPNYASCLYNLSDYYFQTGNLNEAIKLGTEALEIKKRLLGADHPDYAITLSSVANYYFVSGLFESGEFDKAIQLLDQSFSINKKNILRTFMGLTTNERRTFWNLYGFDFIQKAPFLIAHSEKIPGAASMLYDNTALFAKGLLLSTELEMTKLIQESGDTEVQQMYADLRENRQILNMQYSKPLAERSIDCDSLEKASSNLERQLVSRVKGFGDYTKNLSITWQDIQSKLIDDDIAIEFISYHDTDENTSYVALTLCKNDTAPILTPLFTENNLLEASGENGTYQTTASDALVWGPLASRLEDKNHVYFSASGMLHNIGIEYMPSMEGKDCFRLSSTRELVTHKPSSSISSATLYGDIDYDASFASIKTATPRSDNYYAMNAEAGLQRGNFDYRSMRYGVAPLPGTRVELDEVSALLKPQGVTFDTLTGTKANEESFKALSGQHKSLLHISTHGFYYSDEDANNLNDHLQMMLIGDNRPTHFEDKSLIRCGLCFAGANQTLSGDSQPSIGQGDGILNALEIAQTDLRGLDLVVLSACQTALGDITQGEGVFGLQRGFKKAGAQSILMSLWNVDDEVTQLLMTEFYRGWTSGQTKTEALRNAQSTVKAMYPDPRHWAAFILLDALD